MRESEEANAKVPPAEESKTAKWTRIVLCALGFAIVAVIMAKAFMSK
jgi:hypothetical protein